MIYNTNHKSKGVDPSKTEGQLERRSRYGWKWGRGEDVELRCWGETMGRTYTQSKWLMM